MAPFCGLDLRNFFICCIFLLLSSTQILSLATQTRSYKWDVEFLFWSPDCKESIVIGINGQFPGPTIRAKAGDTIIIELTNKLHTEGVVIHWHGIRQLETPWADGTASISQCAIDPGDTFVYKFKVDKAGTYFYHGHLGMQRTSGLYGSLIVDVAQGEEEPFHYDGEFSLLLSDWWHISSHEQEVDLSSSPLHWIGEPKSLLINGRGQYNCSLAAHYSNGSTEQCNVEENKQCAPDILQVLPNRTYRLRIASTASLVSLNLAIDNHEMLVVEADGNYLQPFTVENIDIHPGESYSVLLTTNQSPSENYWIAVGVIRGRVPIPQALTILNYPNSSSLLPTLPPPITPEWNDEHKNKTVSKNTFALMGSPKPPKNFNRRITIVSSQKLINGSVKWVANGIALVLPPTPYLGAIKFGLKEAFDQKSPPETIPDDYDLMEPPGNPNATYGNGVYMLGFDTTVDIILQNSNDLAPNESELHPWHLHGHDFWVLGYGEGKFRNEDENKFNLENPPLRNTAIVYPYGWTALRFVADNPGVWAFHCHIESHLHMGMGVVFAEGVDRVGKIPNEALACGLTGKKFLKPQLSPYN